MHDSLKAQIRDDWRELGFFCDSDAAAKKRTVVGSRLGLAAFSELLRRYVADPRNAMQSEHEHYGPYMDLELMTWTEAGMDDHAIHGTLRDLERLAKIVETRAAELQPGQQAQVREEYSASSEYALVLDLREDGFDPASMDGNLRATAT